MKKKNRQDLSPIILIFLSYLWKILFFIIKIPYYIVKGIILLARKSGETAAKAKEKSEAVKIEKKRESIPANYEEFTVVEPRQGDFSSWEENIINAESKIGIILGARGSGKSAFGIKFLENVYAKSKKKCYAIGFKKEDMPSFITVVEEISELKNNAFVLIDEGGILFSSRESMSNANKFLSDLILVARHKNLNILFISQNSSNLDVNILRQADYLVLKQSSLLQLDFERKKIKEIYEEVKEDYEKFKAIKGITYIYSDQFQGFVTNTLPSFWNVNISKSFK